MKGQKWAQLVHSLEELFYVFMIQELGYLQLQLGAILQVNSNCDSLTSEEEKIVDKTDYVNVGEKNKFIVGEGLNFIKKYNMLV